MIYVCLFFWERFLLRVIFVMAIAIAIQIEIAIAMAKYEKWQKTTRQISFLVR